ncbi:calcium channel flower-like isoform X1 [Varroa jacobsoni]|uniref:Calcium channel flower n=2 Tax=Varroa TaxID=62624 RepID=A0A7M7KJ75_VARDE|nr:calcium channel flower-like [Varroa destructor]XP_022688098.1 calcium channel flower-like isoform X1 [Varroa jacobsoni]
MAATLLMNMNKVPTGAMPTEKDMDPNDSIPWYLKYGARVVGIIASLFAIGMGIQLAFLSALTISFWCLLAAILQCAAGLLVALLEAPYLCAALEFAKKPGQMIDGKPLMLKAGIYCVAGIVPALMCMGITTMLGSGLIFCCGLMYGMIAMGRKAPQADMAAAATANGATPMSPSMMEAGVPLPPKQQYVN